MILRTLFMPLELRKSAYTSLFPSVRCLLGAGGGAN